MTTPRKRSARSSLAHDAGVAVESVARVLFLACCAGADYYTHANPVTCVTCDHSLGARNVACGSCGAQGDGSCLFHSMNYGLQRIGVAGGGAGKLRRSICAFLESHPNTKICDTPVG